jgi:UDP-N-acetylglucosamine 1-carboxyvinyltransferase
MLSLLRKVGADVHRSVDTVTISTDSLNTYEAPYEYVSRMRASIYVLGPLLARFGKARVALPGGCAFGPRPINFHIYALQSMGASVKVEHGYVVAEAPKGLKGTTITFERKSVGATIHTMTTAVLSEGKTVIENAAIEPEVVDVARFLKRCGADIEGEGTDRITVTGRGREGFLDSCDSYRVIPDRIEAATFVIAGLITGGEVEVKDAVPEHLTAVLNKLKEAGAHLSVNGNSIKVLPSGRLNGRDVETSPYPGFPTDVQPLYMALMAVAKGVSIIRENIYPDRFKHAYELMRPGASIDVGDGYAVVKGVERLTGAPVMGADLRGTAALVLAGLAAKGETTVGGYYHLSRGYENFVKKMLNLGADITLKDTL